VIASVVLVVALASTLALRRQPAALRHWVLAVALGCAAATPLLSAMLPSWHVSLGSVLPPRASAGEASSVTTTIMLQDPADRTGQPAGTPQAAPTPGETMAVWLQRSWVAGAVVSFMVLGVGLARLRRVASRARRLERGPWVDLAADIRRALGLRRTVDLLQSDHPTLLVTWGLARPAIMLPAGAQTWPNERARLVLQHEMEHIRRGDWIVQLLGEILRAVYWFNPLVWIVCRRLRYESEHACDDAVLNHGVEPTDYAALLVDLARTLNAGRTIRVPAPAMARASSLEGRVSAMLNARLNRTPITRSTRIATVILFLCLTVPMSGLAAQHFSTFSGTLADQTNAVLPNVAVTVTNPATQTRHEVRTDRTGHFELLGLPDGDYQVAIAEPGFAPVTEPLTIAGRDVTRAIQLQLGDLHETITIVGGGGRAIATDPGARQKARQWADERSRKAAERCGAAGTSSAGSNIGGNILQPTKVADVKPRYPESLQATKIGGVVMLDALIGTDGTVRDVRVASGDPALGIAAMDAVRQWEFSPTYLNCTPVEVRMGVTVNFVAQ
jgi:TonB family protein